MGKFEFDRADSIESAVFQALGAASTCWESLDNTGIFQSDRAKEIGEELLAFIRAYYAEPYFRERSKLDESY